MTNREFDEQFRRRGAVLLGGIDEAGRGPLAGPVFAAAVILDPARPVEGLNDSKKLSEAKREALFDPIREQAVAWAVASASASVEGEGTFMPGSAEAARYLPYIQIERLMEW